MSSTAPNLEAFLGLDLSRQLVQRVGGLSALSQLSGPALLRVGLSDTENIAEMSRMKQLRAGLLSHTPTFIDYFGEDEVPAHSLRGARKSLEIIGRKVSILARTDEGKARPDGSLGREEREKLNESCERLLKEGKVAVEDTQALAAPEAFTRDARNNKRGGLKLHKRRQNDVGVLERATARVRMGESEEEQREKLIERADIRAELMKEQEKLVLREGRKRQRQEPQSEYSDLMSLSL